MAEAAAVKTRILRGARLFDGEGFLDNHALVLENEQISAVVPAHSIDPTRATEDLGGGVLAPGFIDAQVNGGGGVLLNEQPDLEGAATIARTHRSYGTTGLLPTLITDAPDITARAIAAVREAIAAKAAPGVIGLHLEGPFLAPGRKGAHSEGLIRKMADDDVEQLLSTGLETLLITVAPDQVEPKLIRRLVDGGVTVSLGHSDADYETLCAAVDAGARGVTHLFNAMSPLSHRAPGMVGGALDRGELWCGIIADGHHVHPAVLRAALRAKAGPGRLFLVTDAMPTVGCAQDQFVLNGRRVLRKDGQVTLEDGTLAGSDLDMAQAVRFAMDELALPPSEALRMASLYPAQFLGLGDRFGALRSGYRADLVLLDDDWRVRRTWIAGDDTAA
ncbi:N-acetylglucosamine-6-phosphate deacetylase [Denitrobaculum tricleocarpae]|uniref:N-acetylglucosamine-6-phosphate deacetylase n=1 Tax=Denitrobaculum tricleocarpae TaxID=2591009 RepID=A0A545U2H8_9PROT|nr:N-acetylglucosamine-6-phosphate deacetylase [Denitrobaculum tricleocarpae]TQV83682.1 N-acetylglucosamine-6-phosphate deacetylase [Denitrobaculum tricleocarpae]